MQRQAKDKNAAGTAGRQTAGHWQSLQEVKEHQDEIKHSNGCKKARD